MNSLYLIFVILFPAAAGPLPALFGIKNAKTVQLHTLAVTLLTSAAAWAMILFAGTEPVVLISFTDWLRFTLTFDGLGRFFAGIVATLWPLTVVYALEYMKHDPRQHVFYAFFMMAYGATLGITMSGNLFTLYCFYELLTLTTVPLVIHGHSREAVRATRIYFSMSLGGAAFAFVSMIFLIINGNNGMGANLTRLFYLFGFFGFGVKAAVFPLYYWLPRASVAPTPVTALLHAVAVVKSGVFAIIRLTWFGYGTEVIAGSYAHYVVLSTVIFTIFFGSAMALRETHFKRRLAYSTVANLSYILFGILLFTEEGFTAGLLHMAFHAEIKILAFFAAGAVLHVTGREYIQELDGLGRRMPVTFACFTVSALALIGIPPFAGFVSKWHLLSAAASAVSVPAYIGAGVILVSALLTAIYTLTTVRRAFFPDNKLDTAALSKVHEADLRMLVPMCILAAALLITGLFAGRILDAIQGFMIPEWPWL